jgi:hypothetical protein
VPVDGAVPLPDCDQLTRFPTTRGLIKIGNRSPPLNVISEKSFCYTSPGFEVQEQAIDIITDSTQYVDTLEMEDPSSIDSGVPHRSTS